MTQQDANRYHAIILAGGLGTRLWPRSRTSKP
ncbi:MAG: sugar phosphate nucleotidyltransferase, partial [Dissulfurimicrobium sp.]